LFLIDLMGSIADRKALILIFPKGVDGILAVIFCFAGCVAIYYGRLHRGFIVAVDERPSSKII
jgi:hypothetical protein